MNREMSGLSLSNSQYRLKLEWVYNWRIHPMITYDLKSLSLPKVDGVLGNANV